MRAGGAWQRPPGGSGRLCRAGTGGAEEGAGLCQQAGAEGGADTGTSGHPPRMAVAGLAPSAAAQARRRLPMKSGFALGAGE